MLAALPWLLGTIIGSVGGSIVQNAGAQSRQDAMNAYNTPAAQMARYSAAGLNPNLIYSQGSPGLQSSPVQFASPDIDPTKIWSLHQAYLESKARSELAHQRSAAQHMIATYQLLKNKAEAPFYIQNAQYQSSLMKHSIQKTLTQTGNLDQVYANLIKDGKIKDELIRQNDFYNQYRDYGIDRGDSPLYRIGTLMLKKYFPSIRVRK